MALTTDLALNPQNYGGANVTTTFVFVTEKDQKSLRRVTATALTSPDTLTVQHTLRKQGSLDVDSHLVRRDLTKTDVLQGPVTASVWCSLNYPKGQTAITADDIKRMFGEVAALLCAAGIMDKVLAGES